MGRTSVTEPRRGWPRLVVARCFAFCVSSGPMWIPALPAAQGIGDPTLSLPPASLSEQAVGVPFEDPVFGTTLRRITGARLNGGWGTHIYSQLQAFSADNVYVLLIEDDEYVVRRLADLSEIAGLDTTDWNAPRWQPARVHTIVHYDTNGDADVTVQYTSVDSLTTADIYTFPAQYRRVMNNQSFDELSRDGRWMAGMVARSDGAGVIFALDLSTGSLGAELPVPDLYAGPCQPDPVWGEVEPDWIGVSPLGNHLVVQWARDGTTRCSGLETFDLASGAFVGRVYDGHQHGDLGLMPDGMREFFMTHEFSSPMDNSRPAIAYRLLPGTSTVSDPVYLQVVDWSDEDHISCQGPRGVCLVTWGSWSGDGWTPFEDELFLVYTDGSVLRLTHHRSSKCGYWVQPRASLSADGTFAIFASDWGLRSCGGLGRGDTYVVELPPSNCGNGDLDEGEECDDGNAVDGDGCDGNCTLTACGNGIITSGEDCDDGNTADLDCCSSTCRFESAGSTCPDADVCNGAESCDGAGRCASGTPLDCDDGDVCTSDSCDPGLGCQNIADVGSCDDGDPCTVDACDPVSGCQSVPIPGCVQLLPLAGDKLMIRNNLPDDESRNRIVFLSTDRAIALANPGSSGDPRCGGAGGGSIEISSTTSGQRLSQSLPCQNWTLVGTETAPKAYTYRDKAYEHGPCKSVTIRNQRLVSGRCLGRGPAALDYDLKVGQPQAVVNVRITTGTSIAYCSQFGGNIRKDGTDARTFLAKRAVAPPSCP